MKVIDLEQYRDKKLKEALGKKMAELALCPQPGRDCAREMKICFKEWVKTANRK